MIVTEDHVMKSLTGYRKWNKKQCCGVDTSHHLCCTARTSRALCCIYVLYILLSEWSVLRDYFIIASFIKNLYNHRIYVCVDCRAVFFSAACPNGFYGNCTMKCGNCKDGVPCDKVIGSCSQCNGNYQLPLCTGRSITICDVVVNVLSADVIIICVSSSILH